MGQGWFSEEYDTVRITRFDWGVYIFTILYSLIFLLLTIFKLWFNDPQKSIYKSIRFLSTIHAFFYLVYFIVYWPDESIEHTEPNRVVAYIFLFLAQISFYALMTLRLYQTFRSTIYQLTKRTIYFSILLGLLLTLSWIIWFAQGLYLDHIGGGKDTENWFNYIVLTCIFSLSCIFGFVLVWLFIQKLYKLILSQRQSIHIWNDKRITTSLSFSSFNGANYNNYSKTSTSRSNYGNSPYSLDINPNENDQQLENRESVELTEKQKSLLSTMVKNSILGIIAILLYQLMYFLGPIVVIDYRIEVAHKFGFALAIFFEMLCIYLTFKANDNTYQCLCGKCHNLCQKCIKKCVQKKVKELNQKQMEIYDTSKTLIEETSLTEETLKSFINYSDVHQ